MVKEEEAQVRLKVEFRDKDGKWKRSNTWYYFKAGELMANILKVFIPSMIDSFLGGEDDKS
jgi:hypothetical protein